MMNFRVVTAAWPDTDLHSLYSKSLCLRAIMHGRWEYDLAIVMSRMNVN